MTDYAGLIATSSVPWLIGAALVLGGLHALEPGHSKTMIAAFIAATRGTATQAVLLGLSAAFSHSLLIWVLAVLALLWGNQFVTADMEPYLQVLSGIAIAGIGASVIWRQQRATAHGGHDHGHHHEHGPHHHHHDRHGGQHLDAHAAAHARDLQRQLAGGTVSNGQVLIFGFSGGLLPCPAAFTALLVCIRLKQPVLGFSLVLAFSVGLAAMLVAVGVVAALGARHAARHLPDMPRAAAALPYVSGALIMALGAYMALSGWTALGGTI